MSANQPNESMQKLASAYQLVLEAGMVSNSSELTFHILNNTIKVCAYDRASLWSVKGKRLSVKAFSGQANVDRQAPLINMWSRVVNEINDISKPMLINTIASESKHWNELRGKTGGLSAYWLPITVSGKVVAGICFERWGESTWAENDTKILSSLSLGFAGAWEKMQFKERQGISFINKRTAAIVMAVVLLALIFIRIPLRVVAPCEVIADTPHIVSAPINGVVEKVKVKPGNKIKAGDLLFIYDKRGASEELDIVAKQVDVMQARLQRYQVEAFSDSSAAGEIALLEHKLSQERVRLKAAKEKFAKLEYRAPIDGVVMLNDPGNYSGRPVQIGERVMTILTPGKTKVKIWIDESDILNFDNTISVMLNSEPSRRIDATLAYTSIHASPNDKGFNSFISEAKWNNSTVMVGSQGTAVLRGNERVSLAYWLLRKPLAFCRNLIGL